MKRAMRLDLPLTTVEREFLDSSRKSSKVSNRITDPATIAKLVTLMRPSKAK